MTYYEMLEVSANASEEVIRMAYKALVKKYHPDNFKGSNDDSEEKIKQLNVAFETLSDPLRRKKYDESLKKEKKQSSSSSFNSANEKYAESSVHEYQNSSGHTNQRYRKWYVASGVIIITLVLVIVGLNSLNTQKTISARVWNSPEEVYLEDKGMQTIIVAVETNYEPFSYVIGDRCYGIHVEMALEMASRIGGTPIFIAADFSELVSGVEEGRFDMASGIEKTPYRAEVVSFTEPYYDYMCIIFRGDTFSEYTAITYTLQGMMDDGTVDKIISAYIDE